QTNVQAMIGLAGVARATGEEAEYVDWLETAAQSGAPGMRARLLLANYHLQKKDVGKALAAARDAVSAEPNNPDALDLLGTAQLAAGEKGKALFTYGKLVALAPKDPVARYKLATVQLGMQDIGAARSSLNEALSL